MSATPDDHEESVRAVVTEAEDPVPESTEHDTARIWKLVTSVVAPGTAILALLYYFGVVRTQAFYRYLGVDEAVLHISSNGYVFRSAEAAWPILTILVLMALFGLIIDGWTRSLVSRGRCLRPMQAVALSALIAGVLLLAGGMSQVLRQGRPSLIAPVVGALGVVLCIYSRRLHLALAKREEGSRKRALTASRTISALLSLLLLLTLFWGAARFAEGLGRGSARLLESTHFAAIPDVTIYLQSPIDVMPRGVESTDLGEEYEPYRYRYSGFKLLVRGEGRILLVPYAWDATNAFALVLPDDDSVRIVFSPNL